MHLSDIENSYDGRVKEWLNKIQPDIWKYFNEVPALTEDKVNEGIATSSLKLSLDG